MIAGSIGVTDDAPSPSFIPYLFLQNLASSARIAPFTIYDEGRLISQAVPMNGDDARLIKSIPLDTYCPLLFWCR